MVGTYNLWRRVAAIVLGMVTLAATACEASVQDADTFDPDSVEIAAELSFLEQPRALSSSVPEEPSRWSTYDCLDGWVLRGGEHVYAIDLPAAGQLAAEIEVRDGSNAAVVIFGAGDDGCLAGDPTRAVAQDLEPGRYFVVVDIENDDQAGAEYRLAVEPDAYDTWIKREVAPGIVWQRWFGREHQGSINVLRYEQDSFRSGYAVRGVWGGGRCESVPSMAEREGALAGINGAFSKRMTEDGVLLDAPGPPSDKTMVITHCELYHGIVKIDGEVHGPNENTQMTLGVDGHGALAMKWLEEADTWNEVSHALGGYPSLIPYEDVGDFARWDAPRTMIGLTASNELLMVTVDGRTDVGDGMRLPAARDLMHQLGAVQAMNVDGGGSTTMWIRGTTLNGVVNYPSDGWTGDRQADHGNPRRVSDGLFLFD